MNDKDDFMASVFMQMSDDEADIFNQSLIETAKLEQQERKESTTHGK